MTGKIYISWADIDEMVEDLYQQLKDKNIDKVVGISRGGLIPGVMLSHRLNAGFEPLEWQTRDGEVQNSNQLRQLLFLLLSVLQP